MLMPLRSRMEEHPHTTVSRFPVSRILWLPCRGWFGIFRMVGRAEKRTVRMAIVTAPLHDGLAAVLTGQLLRRWRYRGESGAVGFSSEDVLILERWIDGLRITELLEAWPVRHVPRVIFILKPHPGWLILGLCAFSRLVNLIKANQLLGF